MNQFNLLKNKSGKEKIVFAFILLILSSVFISFVLADDWPMFRHDTNRSGISGDSVNMTDFGVKWKYLAGNITRSSPVGGYLF